jgi:hypothetical protein
MTTFRSDRVYSARDVWLVVEPGERASVYPPPSAHADLALHDLALPMAMKVSEALASRLNTDVLILNVPVSSAGRSRVQEPALG